MGTSQRGQSHCHDRTGLGAELGLGVGRGGPLCYVLLVALSCFQTRGWEIYLRRPGLWGRTAPPGVVAQSALNDSGLSLGLSLPLC